MTSSEIYDAIGDWLVSHNFSAGYRLQKRFWKESEGSQIDRFMVIQRMGGANSEEAVTRDSYRILLISAIGDTNIDEVDDLASRIRSAMLDDYQTGCIISMRPIGGISDHMSENRIFFEINFNTIISR
ncbi:MULTISPECIES: phage tail termination protein [Providencia]|uniref:Uncharacterized protein n=1 Tax=Providencia rettgeri TaxID=587 RepID=A0AAD2VP67_PRORE|nr:MULTISPECIES: hypothetical protein [Providencia]ELR5215895.1 hypothetical protein [Providencia rettgeri]MDH2304981.1 hypothetical protein [Providencia rettgeri]